MKIFPAIDLFGGQAVRLFKGDYDQMTVYDPEPLNTVRKFEAAGASCLHLVDLEGAKTGQTTNLPVIEKLAANTGLFIEVGGGIRTMDNIDEVLAAGVQRVILGSVAAKNPALVQRACAKYGERIVVGIDAKNGIVAVEGWEVSGNVEAGVLARQMAQVGVKTIIYTDISRDGTLEGVNVEATAQLARQSGVKVVASGGVKSIEDIKALLPYEKDGIEGVIVGKAIYTGTLHLSEAIRVAAGE